MGSSSDSELSFACKVSPAVFVIVSRPRLCALTPLLWLKDINRAKKKTTLICGGNVKLNRIILFNRSSHYKATIL